MTDGPVTHSPLRSTVRRPDDIARSLASEFERALFARLGTSSPADPVLTALFQSFAVQVGRLYDEAESAFPLAVLDDLMEALGEAPRLARPAQTVVQFGRIEEREVVGPDTECTGYGRSGEPLTFSLDDVCSVVPGSVAFAGVAEGGRLIAVPGARLPGSDVFLSPGSTPLRAHPSDAPSLYLAFDIADADQLSDASLFLDVAVDKASVSEALGISPWVILGADGQHEEAGVMRSTKGPGGVRRLRLGVRPDAAQGPAPSETSSGRPPAPSGPYAARTYIFPQLTGGRRVRGLPPASLRDALRLLAPPGFEAAFSRPLAWIHVPLPTGVHGVASALQRIALNCMSASNLEVFTEHVPFDRLGTAVQMRPEGRQDRTVMSVLSVVGEQGDHYVRASSVEAPEHAGRFRFRAGQLNLVPGRGPTGRIDRFAVVRLILSDGPAGNGLAVGELRQLRTMLGKNPVAEVSNPVPSRGGELPPPFVDARLRFAEVLRTRHRLVTTRDLELAALAFDSRIKSVRVLREPALGPEGVRMADALELELRRDILVDVDAESGVICSELLASLRERVPAGRLVTVRMRPEQG